MLALIFPGQGSQRPGMGAPWQAHPSWAVVGQLSQATGRDIAELLVEAGPETLRATRNAQLATYALSLVALDAARRGPLAAFGPEKLAAVLHPCCIPEFIYAARTAVHNRNGSADCKYRLECAERADVTWFFYQ